VCRIKPARVGERMTKDRGWRCRRGRRSNGQAVSVSSNPTTHGAIKSDLLHDCPFWHPTVLMRKDAFVAVGGYRRAVVDAEDYDLWSRIADRFQLANLDAVVLKYRIHPCQVTVRKCRQMAFSNLAARAAAASRRCGKADPLDSIREINPAVLARRGASEAAEQAALAGRYLSSIRSMSSARENDGRAICKCAAALLSADFASYLG
jgi:hypothetical protein